MNDENKFLDCKGRKVSVGDMVRPIGVNEHLGNCKVVALNPDATQKPFEVEDENGGKHFFNPSWTERVAMESRTKCCHAFDTFWGSLHVCRKCEQPNPEMIDVEICKNGEGEGGAS